MNPNPGGPRKCRTQDYELIPNDEQHYHVALHHDNEGVRPILSTNGGRDDSEKTNKILMKPAVTACIALDLGCLEFDI